MKELNYKEFLALDRDIKKAQILVYHKHGFSNKEISELLDVAEATVAHTLYKTIKNGKES